MPADNSPVPGASAAGVPPGNSPAKPPKVPPEVIQERLVISGIALIPFSVVAVLFMLVLYPINGGLPLTRSVFGDIALWVIAFGIYFGTTYGLMFTPVEDWVADSKQQQQQQ
jgi:uncharacterized RDD family membrane protein YckC